MSRIRVSATEVKVLEGQGIGEGDFELSLNVIEGAHSWNWPSFGGSVKVDNGGAPMSLGNGIIAYYTVSAGTLSKKFKVNVREDDTKLNADDIGSGDVDFIFEPNMRATNKSVDIELNRTFTGGEKGKVRVTLTAQVA